LEICGVEVCSWLSSPKVILTFMNKKQQITVQNLEISILNNQKNDFISLTDIAKYKNPNEPNDDEVYSIARCLK
jgi:hypothetical protein